MTGSRWLVLGLLLTVGGSLALPAPAREAEAPPPPAPDFRLRTLQDQEVTLARHRGKVVLLNFWATWCIPCKKEIPHLNGLAKRHADDLVVLGLSADRLTGTEGRVAAFAESQGVTYPVLIATEPVIDAYFPDREKMEVPTTFLIDREGVLRRRLMGYRTAEALTREVTALIGASAPEE